MNVNHVQDECDNHVDADGNGKSSEVTRLPRFVGLDALIALFNGLNFLFEKCDSFFHVYVLAI